MSRTFRAFVFDDHLPRDGTITLTGEESHHLHKVLRIEVGKEVEAINGRGVVWRTEVVDAGDRSSVLRILDKRNIEPAPVSFEMAVAIPKGGRMDDVVRQLTELGISTICPLVTERSEVGGLLERVETKLEKWERIAIQACKQSGNPWLPVIRKPLSFEKWSEQLSGNSVRLLGSLVPEAKFISSFSRSEVVEVAIGIGPEGGFSQLEQEVAKMVGFTPVRFGPHVLRVETAAVCALAVAQEIFGL